MSDLGLYIHIPFCIRRCRYCDFASSTGRESLIPAYRMALIEELERERAVWNDGRIGSVFFGGGTPSLWPAEELSGVLDGVRRRCRHSDDVEISFEANPGTVDRAKLSALRQAGFNRISIGAQSGDDRLLKTIGRVHSVRDMERAVEDARNAGFDNLNIDLIYGLPGQTIGDWKETLQWAVGLAPDHLSCYGLQIEEGTPLAADVACGRVIPATDDEIADMMLLTMTSLPAFGYAQYEISNYARPGYECRHNLHYWEAGDYLGLGAGAVSTVGDRRWSNTESIEDYLEGFSAPGGPPREYENLSGGQSMVEAVMLGLRIRRGLVLTDFLRRFGVSLAEALGDNLAAMIGEGWLIMDNGRLRLSERAVPVGNAIIGRLCGSLLEEG